MEIVQQSLSKQVLIHITANPQNIDELLASSL